MEVIPRKTVDTVWIQAGQNTVDELIARKKEFKTNQHPLHKFLIKFTEHLNPDMIELSFYYTSIIWEIFNITHKNTLQEVGQDIIYSCIDERETWLENINGFNYQQMDKLIAKDDTIKQTNILCYALDAIFEEGEDNLEFNSEDQAYLFWLLIIVVDVLDKITS